MARLTVAASSASDGRGNCTALTLSPLAASFGMTSDQLEPSAHAPWTSTMFFDLLIKSSIRIQMRPPQTIVLAVMTTPAHAERILTRFCDAIVSGLATANGP